MPGTESPLVLVTGATGAVGPAVVRRAVDEGCRVRTLSRHAPQQGLLPSGVDVQIGDVREQDVLARALAGVEYVLHLAAVLHFVTPEEQQRADYESVNAAATTALVRRARSEGVQRIVLFSTIGVYGENRDVVATEDTAPAPDTPYARTKLEAEKAILAEAARDGHRLGVALRLAAVYGPRVRGNYRTMVRFLANRRFLPLRPGPNRRTLVFDEDAAQAALLVMRHPAAAGRVFNVTDGTTHSVEEVTESICAALNRRPPRVGMPASLPRLLLRAAGPIASVPPIARAKAMLEKYTQDIAVDGSLIQRELGFTPRVDLDEGWRRTVAGLRRNGDLQVRR